MASFPIGQGYDESQWESWFAAFAQANPKMPTYTGTNTSAKGKTWDQVYAVLYAKGQTAKPADTPDEVAEATIVLAETQGFADGIGAVVTTVGNLPQISAESVTQGATKAVNSVPGLGAALTWEQAIAQFFGSLGQASTWERIAEVLIGAALIVSGVSHLFNVKLPSVVPLPV